MSKQEARLPEKVADALDRFLDASEDDDACDDAVVTAERALRSAILAALDEARDEALTRAERVCNFGPAHTHASENADHYRGFDAGALRCRQAIRALKSKPGA